MVLLLPGAGASRKGPPGNFCPGSSAEQGRVAGPLGTMKLRCFLTVLLLLASALVNKAYLCDGGVALQAKSSLEVIYLVLYLKVDAKRLM